MKIPSLAFTAFRLLLYAAALLGFTDIAFAGDGPFALSFNGANALVSVPHNFLLDPFEMTVTAWINTTQMASESGLINKYVAGSDNGWQVFIYNGEVRAWYFGDATHYIWDLGRGLNGGSVANGAWHHIAFTMDASGGKLYVDGGLKDSMPWTGVRMSCTTTQQLSLGYYPGSGTPYYSGKMDEVTFWTTAQSQPWIQEHMDRGLIGTEPTLEAYYRLNEGTGTNAVNSGDPHLVNGPGDGTLSGPSWVPGLFFRPGLLTLPAGNITRTAATIAGVANPENTNTIAWFEWGLTTNYGNATSPQSMGGGNTNVNFTDVITNLTAGMFYHFRAVASNSLGISLGDDRSFFSGGSMITPRANYTLTLLPNGKVLAAAGMTTNSAPIPDAELYDQASGTWTSTAPLNIARYFHTATVLQNGKVLVTGGSGTNNGAGVAMSELYDPLAGTWTTNGTMTINRIEHTATLLPNGKVLVTGGQSRTPGGFVNFLSTAEVYDPATGIWTATSPMSAIRYNHTATLLPNGKVLVAGGHDASAYLASAEIYDPVTGLWTGTGPLATPRMLHSATLMANGKVIAMGGINATFPSTAEIYDPNIGTWTTVTATEPNSRYQHPAVLLPNGQVAAIAGIDAGNSVDIYDPTTATWNILGISDGLSSQSAVLLPNGKVLAAGGFVAALTNEAVFFDPSVNYLSFNPLFYGTNTITGTLVKARELQTATLLPNGQVLIAGGATNNNATTIATAELFNPVTGTFTTAASMKTNRVNHRATLLPNGTVLVTGGTAGGNYLSSAEIYNPGTGLWSFTGSMTTNHASHTATLLPSGKVLVAGGISGPFTFSTGAELYDPNTGTWTNTGPMNSTHSSHFAVLLANGKVLLGGGTAGFGQSAVAELFDPQTETWTLTGTMNVARGSQTATLLPNGKVLAAGGGTSELYDPASGTWTPTGLMTTNRTLHTATLLPNGRVFVAGGRTGLFSYLTTTELYDPILGTWTPTGPLHVSRFEHTSTLLPDGRTLIAGGFGTTNGLDLSTNELFDTSVGFSNSWRPQISAVAPSVALGDKLTISGSKFRGLSEASDGSNNRDSSTDFPLVQLRCLDSERTVFLTTTNWSTNSCVTAPVWGLPPGPALATIFVNSIPSTGAVVSINIPAPTPPILTDPKFLPDGSFQFTFTNAVGSVFGALATTNLSLSLSNWIPLSGVTEISPGQFQFIDSQGTNDPQLFYGVRSR